MPAGRPHELTAEIVKQVGELLPRTLYVETVADQIGVHRDTVRGWIKRGGKEQRRRERGKTPNPALDLHCQLIGVVKKGLAEQEANYLAGVQLAGEGGVWQAMAWILERRFPDRWAGNRKEMKELREQLTAILKAVDSGQLRTDPKGEGGSGTSKEPRPKPTT